MWQHRSRIQWLKGGDQNTKKFHGLATHKKRRNFIKGLCDGNGVWQKDEEVVLALLLDYYSQLFTSSSLHDLELIVEGVQPIVSNEMRVTLANPYTSEEVGVAMSEMAPLKALGPDGMTPQFFKLIGLM